MSFFSKNTNMKIKELYKDKKTIIDKIIYLLVNILLKENLFGGNR
jgi:hypothetical protein